MPWGLVALGNLGRVNRENLSLSAHFLLHPLPFLSETRLLPLPGNAILLQLQRAYAHFLWLNHLNLLQVAILCTGSALSQVQVPCYGEGCANVTVYLGPRWGSRVIMVPRTETTTGPGEVSEHRYEHEERRPQHRPVPLGGKFHVNFSDDESSYTSTPSPFRTTSNTYRWLFPWATRRPWRTTTNRPNPEVGVVVTRGTLDLSWRGYTGSALTHTVDSSVGFDARLNIVG